MKKYLLIILMLVMFPINALAAGGFSVSPNQITMYPGETKTFIINTNNAVGKLDISSSNASVVSVNLSSVFIQNPGASETITVTAKALGSVNVVVKASDNFATMDEEILAGKTASVTINVVNKPNYSKNNNLKELSIEGHDVVKINDNNYSLVVGADINEVNIKALAEDAKAKVTGDGIKQLKDGENHFEVIITSEAGVQNKISVYITKNDGYSISDLKKLLNNDEIDTIDIVIDSNSILLRDQLNEIKNSKKSVNFNFLDEDKNIIYSWVVDGNKLQDIEGDINLGVDINYSLNDHKIYEAANYADGIYLSFKGQTNISSGVLLKVYTNNKFLNKESINLYEYVSADNVLNLKGSSIIKNGYVELELGNTTDYFLTLSTISNDTAAPSNMLLIYASIAVVELVIIFIMTILMIVRFKKNKNN